MGTTVALEIDIAECLNRTIASVCRRQYGGSLKSLVLTGSLARNEATICDSGSGAVVLGDAEFLLIFHDAFRLPSAHAIVDLERTAERALDASGIRCRVTFSAAYPRYLSRMRPHIFAFELRSCGKVVTGDREILALIPDFDPRSIPREDAWRLLSNRIVEQCAMLADQQDGADVLSQSWAYATVKLYLDMAASWLVFMGAYAPTYKERERRVEELARRRPAGIQPFPLEEFASDVKRATDFKLNPSAYEQPVGREFWWSAAERAQRLWIWEIAKLRGEPVGEFLPPDKAGDLRIQSLCSRLRGWAYVARRQQWVRSWRDWPRWLRLARHGSPRELVYWSAFGTFFRIWNRSGWTMPLPKREWNRLEAVLPVIPLCQVDEEPEWRQLAREIEWNYQRFLVETRA